MSDLDKLIEAVEGGSISDNPMNQSEFDILGVLESEDAESAYYGSLDAARGLYDTLLGHDAGWVVSQHIAKVIMGEFGDVVHVYESVIPRNPARALLLSTLKAYRSQQ